MAWNVFVVLCTRRRLVLCALYLQPSAASLHGDVGVLGVEKTYQAAYSLEVSVVRAQ